MSTENGLIVIFSKPLRHEYVELLKSAIQCYEGVLRVESLPDGDRFDYTIRSQIKQEIRERLWKALEEK